MPERTFHFGWFIATCGVALACSDPATTSGLNRGNDSAGAGGNVATAGTQSGAGAGGVTGAAGQAGMPGNGGVSGAGEGGTASGEAGASGAGGASGGSAGAGGQGTALPMPSPGCNLQSAQQLASWVEQPKLTVNGKDRQWWVWLPTGYDPKRAYPLIFTFHGCGGPDNYIPMQKKTGSDAIVLRGTGADNGCWTYGGEGDDVQFFDAMLAKAESELCVDTGRVFAMGYSSGAWMTNVLECTRGDKLRATGTLSGGVPGGLGPCKGKFARSTVHDLNDPTNPFDKQGANKELARVLAQNHCDSVTAPVPEDPAPCARYQGCDAGFPVIACRTDGQGHNRQDALAEDAFWRLFSSL